MKGNAPSETRADTIYEFIDTINSWLVASPLKSNFRAPARFLAYRWKINPGIVASPRLPAANIAYGAIAAKLRRGGGGGEGGNCSPADRTESIFPQKIITMTSHGSRPRVYYRMHRN